MAAKDYKLMVTGLTNTVWIGKTSKKDPNLMLDDRRALTKSEIIGVILEWALGETEDIEIEDDGKKILSLTSGGRLMAEIHLDIENIEWLKKK